MRSARIVDLQQQPLLQRLQIQPSAMVWIDCPATSCRLPALQANDDWCAAVNALEGLLSCAGQVLECIERQRVQASPIVHETSAR